MIQKDSLVEADAFTTPLPSAIHFGCKWTCGGGVNGQRMASPKASREASHDDPPDCDVRRLRGARWCDDCDVRATGTGAHDEGVQRQVPSGQIRGYAQRAA